MGDPVDRLFSDRELFADFFTSYYTDIEPQMAMVAECDGEVVGYILCCTRHLPYPLFQTRLLARAIPRICVRLARGVYTQNDRRFLKWFLTRAVGETPRAPRRAAHFHINLLTEHRNTGTGIRLFKQFMREIESAGVREIYGQIQTFDHRRSDKVFERFGFRLFDRRPLSKFKAYGVDNVFVSTFTKSF